MMAIADFAPRRTKPKFHAIDPGFLLKRLDLDDPIAKGAIVENVYAVAAKALRTFDDEIREVATVETCDYLMRGGLAKFNDSKSSFATWLSVVLRSRATDELRRQALHDVRTTAAPLVDEESGRETQLLDAIRGDDSTPSAPLAFPVDRHAIGREDFEAVMAALDEREAEILRARAEGFDYDEIAEQLGLSSGRVRAIAVEARAKARAAVEALG